MKWLRQILLLALVAFPSVVAADVVARQPVLRQITVTQKGEGVTVEISADGPLTCNSYLMPELWKGVIDLPNVDPGQVEPVRSVAGGPVKRIVVRRKEVNEVPVTRIAFDLSREVEMDVIRDPADKGRLVATIRPGRFPAAPAPVAAQPAPAAVPGGAVGIPSPIPATAKPTLQPVVAVTPEARILSAVRVVGDNVEIIADGRLDDVRVFTIKQPNRLVVDLGGVKSAIGKIPVSANRFGIHATRQGQFNGKLRLVFEVGEEPVPPYRVSKGSTGLQISLDRRPAASVGSVKKDTPGR